MAAYVIGAVLSVSDPAKFSEYVERAHPTLEQYGGKIVVVHDTVEVADGKWSPAGIIVVEFESMAQAKKWYNSPEYNPLVSIRTGSSDSGVIFVDGS